MRVILAGHADRARHARLRADRARGRGHAAVPRRQALAAERDRGRQLRARPGADGLLLVAVTGYGQEEDLRRSREAGFDLHFVKPIDPQTLGGLLAEMRRGAATAGNGQRGWQPGP